jgi:hypothetical protein
MNHVPADPQSLRQLATTYRRTVLLIGFGWIAVGGLNSALSQPGAESGSPLPLLLGLVFGVALAVHGYQLAQMLSMSAPPLWAIGMFVPLISLICLLVLSRSSTEFCRKHGVRVGLLGPNLSDIYQLEARAGRSPSASTSG